MARSNEFFIVNSKPAINRYHIFDNNFSSINFTAHAVRSWRGSPLARTLLNGKEVFRVSTVLQIKQSKVLKYQVKKGKL